MNKIIILFLLSININMSSADSINKPTNKCTKIMSNKARLACFDKVFGKVQLIINNSKLVSDIYKNENKRTDFSDDLILTDSFGAITKRMFLTSSSKVKSKYSPVLSFSCIDDITRMQVALTKQIDKRFIKVTFLDKNNSIISSQNWNVLEDGFLLDVGRGLYAIREAKKLFKYKTIKIRVMDSSKEWIFNIKDLKKLITPLRDSCHWKG